MCSSNLSLISALNGIGGQGHASAPFHPGIDTQYPLCKRLGARQGRYGQVREKSTIPRFDPRTVQPAASCYPDHACPVTLTAPTVMLRVERIYCLLPAFTRVSCRVLRRTASRNLCSTRRQFVSIHFHYGAHILTACKMRAAPSNAGTNVAQTVKIFFSTREFPNLNRGLYTVIRI